MESLFVPFSLYNQYYGFLANSSVWSLAPQVTVLALDTVDIDDFFHNLKYYLPEKKYKPRFKEPISWKEQNREEISVCNLHVPTTMIRSLSTDSILYRDLSSGLLMPAE